MDINTINANNDIIIKFIVYDSDSNNPSYTSPCYTFDIDVEEGSIVNPNQIAGISKNITNVNLEYQIKGNKDIKLQVLAPPGPHGGAPITLKRRDNKPIQILDKSHNTNIDQLILKFTK